MLCGSTATGIESLAVRDVIEVAGLPSEAASFMRDFDGRRKH
jgi:hypothetical protein